MDLGVAIKEHRYKKPNISLGISLTSPMIFCTLWSCVRELAIRQSNESFFDRFSQSMYNGFC